MNGRASRGSEGDAMRAAISRRTAVFLLAGLLIVGYLILATPRLAWGAEQGTCGDDVKYELSDAGVLTLSGKGPTYDYEDANPEKRPPWFDSADKVTKVVVGEEITKLGDCLFFGLVNATEVTLPTTLTSLGDKLFQGCDHVSKLTIPQNVDSIGSLAFNWMSGLKEFEVDFRNGHFKAEDKVLYSVDDESLVFYPPSLGADAYTLQQGTKIIRDGAFVNVTNLKSVTLPESLESIGGAAFDGCANITAFHIPAQVKTIEKDAFLNCAAVTSFSVDANNTSFASIDEVLFSNNKDTLLWYPSNHARTEYVTPDGTKNIAYHAFFKVKNLQVFSTATTVESIGEAAFLSAKSLRKVVLNDSLVNLGAAVFETCANLEDVTLPRTLDTLPPNCFDGDTSLKSITLPENLETIEGRAFAETSLASVVLPASVVGIGNMAFSGCPLTAIALPEKLESIGKAAFAACKDLKTVDTTNCTKLSVINEDAFAQCGSLSSFFIPASVEYIGAYVPDSKGYCLNVFTRCSSLERIEVDPANQVLKSIDGVLFTQEEGNVGLISYPLGKGVSKYAVPDGTRYLQNHAFFNQPSQSAPPTTVNAKAMNLEQVTLPASVKAIGQETLSNQTLKKVFILYDAAVAGDEFTAGDNACGKLADGSIIFYKDARVAEALNEKYDPLLTKLVAMQAIGGTLSIDGGAKPQTGDTLTANAAGVTPEGATLAYAWKVDGVVVSEAPTCVIPNEAAYVGKKVTLTAAGVDGFYGSIAVESGAIAKKPVPNPKPTAATGDGTLAAGALVAFCATAFASIAVAARRRCR